MNKKKLDELLKTHKAQPVGHGYIDIIVNRDDYELFVSDLISNGFKIVNISWWEWCPGEKETQYGLGGPSSLYYDGWFSELPYVDDINFSEDENRKTEQIINAIETKSISFSDETVTFKQCNWLTPGIWLDVPDDWRNENCI